MKKSNILKSLDALNEKDVYSLMLFVLYCLKDAPEYSALSELVYAVDKESLMNLLSIFGGTTIRVPTIHEMNVIVSALTLYNLCNLKGMMLHNALKEVERPDIQTKELMEAYSTIMEVMENYDIDIK